MILFVSITVILLCLLLIYNNFHKNKNSLYLSSSLIFLCLVAILHYFTVISPNRFWMALLAGHFIPIYYLIGPFLYFYTRNSFRYSIQLSKIDYLHFLPFAISLLSIIPYYFTAFDTKLKMAQLFIDKPDYITKTDISWLYPSYFNILLRPISILIYSVSCVIILYLFTKKKKNTSSYKKREDVAFKWLVLINSIIVLVAIIYTKLTLSKYFIDKTTTREQANTSLISYVLCMMFSIIPALMLIFPEILYGIQKNKKSAKTKVIVPIDEHQSLEDTAALVLAFVKKEENLLNPNFSIPDICKGLGLKNKEVNYCFNTILKTKFTTLKKELRVELAKKELINGKLDSNSMEGIWMKSGFSSKTWFFVSFKEVTGMTPIEYLKSIE
jgi:AraC-like DNA-binding protein